MYLLSQFFVAVFKLDLDCCETFYFDLLFLEIEEELVFSFISNFTDLFCV